MGADGAVLTTVLSQTSVGRVGESRPVDREVPRSAEAGLEATGPAPANPAETSGSPGRSGTASDERVGFPNWRRGGWLFLGVAIASLLAWREGGRS